jgi:hypothetical protein
MPAVLHAYYGFTISKQHWLGMDKWCSAYLVVDWQVHQTYVVNETFLWDFQIG